MRVYHIKCTEGEGEEVEYHLCYGRSFTRLNSKSALLLFRECLKLYERSAGTPIFFFETEERNIPGPQNILATLILVIKESICTEARILCGGSMLRLAVDSAEDLFMVCRKLSAKTHILFFIEEYKE